MNMAPAPAPELLVFMSVAPVSAFSFRHNMAPASVRFYTLIFSIVLVVGVGRIFPGGH